jgi:aminoglycoside phosphotransferase (APT) family kinase protein
VIHGDLNFRNVLIAPDGTIASVVDWGDVRVGHPSVDLSMVYALLPLEAERAFEAAYGQVPDLWRWVGRFVAVFISLAILVSAQDLGVPREIREAQLCLERLAVGPRP